jgi:hypothetical protein
MTLLSGMIALVLLCLGMVQAAHALADASTVVNGMQFLQLQSEEPSACTPQNIRVRKEW